MYSFFVQKKDAKGGINKGKSKRGLNRPGKKGTVGMADVNLEGLSWPEAEEAIAEIWSCLEEYDIPSPALSVDVGTSSRITVGFSFEEPIWTDLVSHRLLSSVRRVSSRRRPHAPTASADGGASLGLLMEKVAISVGLSVAAPTAVVEPFRRAKRT